MEGMDLLTRKTTSCGWVGNAVFLGLWQLNLQVIVFSQVTIWLIKNTDALPLSCEATLFWIIMGSSGKRGKDRHLLRSCLWFCYSPGLCASVCRKNLPISLFLFSFFFADEINFKKLNFGSSTIFMVTAMFCHGHAVSGPEVGLRDQPSFHRRGLEGEHISILEGGKKTKDANLWGC